MAKNTEPKLTPPKPVTPPVTTKTAGPATSPATPPAPTTPNKPAKPAPARITPARTPAKLEAAPQELPEVEEEKDYLRKYQVRKQAVAGSIDSDPPKGSKAEKMKIKLLSQVKVRMLIPRMPDEDKSIDLTVNLNGYRLDFPKDTYIEVPKQISDVLSESLNQTNIALSQNLIEGDKDKEKALR